MSELPLRIAYKYLSGGADRLGRDLQTLHNACFYAAQRMTLNDPFEGRFDRTLLDRQLSTFRQRTEVFAPFAKQSLDAVCEAVNELLSFVDRYGVFSLSYNPLNELIWSHYGGSHHGFCVGYDLQKLVDFEPNLHYCLNVHYSDSAPQLQANALIGTSDSVDTLQKILAVKSTPWRYEQEVRILTTPPGLHEHDYRAVKKVYFGLRCPETTRLSVMAALAGRGVTYEQVFSPDTSYVLHSLPIPDVYALAPKYMPNLAPIVEGAIYPAGLKPEQRQLQGYLYKAAEIVRREPYCLEIQQVDFSSTKSKPGQPIIYVQYLRASNRWVNHYFNLQDIDKQYAELNHHDSIGIFGK